MESFTDHLMFCFFLGAAFCAIALVGLALLAFFEFVIDIFKN